MFSPFTLKYLFWQFTKAVSWLPWKSTTAHQFVTTLSLPSGTGILRQLENLWACVVCLSLVSVAEPFVGSEATSNQAEYLILSACSRFHYNFCDRSHLSWNLLSELKFDNQHMTTMCTTTKNSSNSNSAVHGSASIVNANTAQPMKRFPMRQEEFNALAKLAGNDACIDCGSGKEVEWASVSFGILFCARCSEVHK